MFVQPKMFSIFIDKISHGLIKSTRILNVKANSPQLARMKIVVFDDESIRKIDEVKNDVDDQIKSQQKEIEDLKLKDQNNKEYIKALELKLKKKS